MPEPPVDLDFIVFGAQKCASTWFCRCLDEHPAVSIGEPYEKRFLTEERGWVERRPNPRFLADWEWYREQFPDKEAAQLRGDGDVELYSNSSGPRVVEEWYPDAKLLAILRDPVDRIHSEYVHRFRNPNKPPETPEEYVEKSYTVARSRYAERLRPWFDTFPREQIEVWTWTDLREEGADIVASAYRFLDIDPGFEPPSLREKVNPHRTKQAWLSALESAARRLRSVGLAPVFDLVNRVGLGPALKDAGERPAEKPPLPEKLEHELRRELVEDVEELEAMLDTDLSAWKPGGRADGDEITRRRRR